MNGLKFDLIAMKLWKVKDFQEGYQARSLRVNISIIEKNQFIHTTIQFPKEDPWFFIGSIQNQTLVIKENYGKDTRVLVEILQSLG